MYEVIVPEIETERFLLRQIKLGDLDEWTRLKYADPEVMRHMPRREMAPRDRKENRHKHSRHFYRKSKDHQELAGWPRRRSDATGTYPVR